MIDALYTLLKKLSVTVMLIAIVDLMLPDGPMRKYARLAGGLVTMLLLVSPLLGFFQEAV